MVDRIANSITLLFFVLWGVSFDHWGWNGLVPFLFALVCTVVLTNVLAKAVSFYAGQNGTDLSKILDTCEQGDRGQITV